MRQFIELEVWDKQAGSESNKKWSMLSIELTRVKGLQEVRSADTYMPDCYYQIKSDDGSFNNLAISKKSGEQLKRVLQPIPYDLSDQVTEADRQEAIQELYQAYGDGDFDEITLKDTPKLAAIYRKTLKSITQKSVEQHTTQRIKNNVSKLNKLQTKAIEKRLFVSFIKMLTGNTEHERLVGKQTFERIINESLIGN